MGAPAQLRSSARPAGRWASGWLPHFGAAKPLLRPPRSSDQTPLDCLQVFGVIFLLFVVVPLVELYVVLQVGQALGALPTVALVLLISTVGAWLVRREGAGVFIRIQQQIFGGNLPTKEIADGALIMFGGTLLLTPGFVTDAIGLGLMIPPIRAVVRDVLVKRFTARQAERTAAFTAQFQAGGNPAGFGTGTAGFGTGFTRREEASREVIDVDVTRVDQPSPGLEPPGSD